MDTLDVLTLAEAKAVLDIDPNDGTKDKEVARVVTATSRKLDHLCGPVVTRTISNETHEFATYRDWGTRTTIEFNFCPVTTIVTVTNYLGTTATVLDAQTPGTSPSNGYYAESYKPDASLLSGVITRKTGLYPYPFGDLVSVTYIAGRYASTTLVDARFKEAASVTLRNSWRPYQQGVALLGEFDVPQQTFPSHGVPNYVFDILYDEIKPQIGFGG